MPTYCYSLPDDTIVEFNASMGMAPQSLLVNGVRAERDLGAEHRHTKSGDPWVDHSSLALMVHPLDIKKYEKDAHEKGVPTKFRKDGMPEFKSSAHQRDYCRAYDFVNHDACWSGKD